jgi:hypothetical protein
MGLPETTDPMSVALDYCETVNSNIEAFLKDKPSKMQFGLEKAKEDFPEFCKMIGAAVRMDAALSEFDKRHNSTAEYEARAARDNTAPFGRRVLGFRSIAGTRVRQWFRRNE